MKSVKEWLKSKNNALFEVVRCNADMKILCVSRLKDYEEFACGDIVQVTFMPLDSLYRIFSFSTDLIHVTLVPRGVDVSEINTLPPIKINEIEQPTLEDLERLLNINNPPN